MKGSSIIGNIDGKYKGIIYLAKHKKFKPKSMMKTADPIPLSMSDLNSKVYYPLRDGESRK